MRHILKSQQFDRQMLSELFSRADEFRRLLEDREERRLIRHRQEGRVLFNLFYEPSTRTRMSFASAGAFLGMRVVTTENARDFSSAIKGETLEDTIRVLCEYYPDVIVIRHYETGAAERAAVISRVPIINAGDGEGQHPTQAILDLYTIQEAHGMIDGLTVVIGGDLANGRTARSLAYLLSKYDDVKIFFVSPIEFGIGGDIKEHLREKEVEFGEFDSLVNSLPHADVVYWTKVQKERLPSEFRDPRARYFRQAGNGMMIRTALLEWVLEEE